jgi:hypothetical protein
MGKRLGHAQVQLLKLKKGTHEVTVRAWDAVGYESGEDEFSWTVGANPPATPPGRQ